MKIGLISLGCAKNLVDSEMILGLVERNTCQIVNEPSKADIIIVNTCGFIESAKQESIDTILEMIDYKKKGAKIVVTGCLAQRYIDNLKELLPEVDLFIPISEYWRFGELIGSLVDKNFSYKLQHDKRVMTTGNFAYVKIAEGCDNKCNYCAIPLIRGGFVSRSVEEIVEEIGGLVSKGIKEIVLISQDTTRYGKNLSDVNLSKLLREITKIEGIEFLRFLYLYPDEITEELIMTVKENPVITPYFDVPIQHASNEILKAMNRRDTKENMQRLFSYIKKEIPNAVLRTTLIVGYPGETTKHFNELVEFIKEVRFDRLGCFMYSKEEDTVAYSLPHQVSKKTKENRYETLMGIQEQISYDLGMTMVGQTHRVVIDAYDEQGQMYIGRSYGFAPDDIDGCIFIETDYKLDIGSYYDCEITGADIYNLYGIVK